jgi:hypothetical protein
VAVVVLAVVFGFGVYLARRGSDGPANRPVSCTVGTMRFDSDQLANAATITAVGIRRELPDQAIVVALAASLQESKLHNLGHLGSSNDHDSIGLFQQRPSQGWGTEDQLLDQRYAADAFYNALLKVDNWDTIRVTDAAQGVQQSAYPEAYQKWSDEAQVLAAAFTGGAPGAVSCSKPTFDGPSTAGVTAELLRRDFGAAAPNVQADQQTLSIPAADARTGWQLAHWLVAQADVTGITKVAYHDQEWSADNGSWTTRSSSSEVVTAQVLPAR